MRADALRWSAGMQVYQENVGVNARRLFPDGTFGQPRMQAIHCLKEPRLPCSQHHPPRPSRRSR